MSVLELRALSKHYGQVKAVDNVDLKLDEGELLAVLGPSGSGKSTLMRMAAGLEMPSSGDIVIDGQSVVGIPPQKRNVAMVFQSFALYPHMSVRKNILFPLVARNVPKEQHQPKLEHATRMLAVDNLLDRRPNQLSGGQRQRVALARALVRDPDLFIFDEPLSALDAQIRGQARAELRELHDQTRITTLYVTHDQVEAMGLADRVAVINNGQLHQVGTPHELYVNPADLFVAGFIGSPPMNLLPQDDETMMGVRPESILVNPEDDVDDVMLDLSVRIEHLEYLGSEWLAYGAVPEEYAAANGADHIVARLSATRRPNCEPGKTSRFVARHADVCLFDRSTGLRKSPRTEAVA